MSNIIQNYWENTIDWGKVTNALQQYPNIAEVFTLKFLQSYNNRPPFYIHPLTRWLHFQGVYTKPALDRLDKIIGNVKTCSGWSSKKKLFSTAGKDSFWNTYAEVEIADCLNRLGFEVEFLQDGNTFDIKAHKNDKTLNIEVTSYSVYFMDLFELDQIIQILNENLPFPKKYDAKIEIARNLGVPSHYSFGGMEKALGDTIAFAQDENKVKEVVKEYPQVIYSADNLQIELNAIYGKPGFYNPGKTKMFGKFDDFMDNMLFDMEQKKKNYKQLATAQGIRMCAINVLFNEDAQVALSRFNRVNTYKLPKNFIDVLLLYANSIDEDFSFSGRAYYLFKDNATRLEVQNLLNLPSSPNPV